MKILRVLCCILSCLCVASAILDGVFCGFTYCLLLIAAACVFAIVMFLAKNRSEEQPKKPDFMDPDPPKDGSDEPKA